MCAVVVGLSVPARAQEMGVGAPVVQASAGLALRPEIGPPVPLEGADEAGRPTFVPPDGATLFLAVDVRASRGNRNGFGGDEFVPYLTVTYALRPASGGPRVRGTLLPLVGSRGLRYGNNVSVPTAGPVVVTLSVEPPIHTGFGRHTDLETDVARWWAPFAVQWTIDPGATLRR